MRDKLPDKTVEDVMDLYFKGEKQNSIAQILRISPAAVCRIINNNALKPEDDKNMYEGHAAVNGPPNNNPAEESASENPETPVNPSNDHSGAPNGDPVSDSPPENPEIPGNSSEDDSGAPDDDPADDSTSEKPEIPGQPFDDPERMKTIAELTSAETARKLTDSYKEIFDLLGAANREIMETSMSGMDKGMRMLLTASERLNALSEKQEKMLASCSGNGNSAELHPEESGHLILYLILALLLNFAVFSFGGICGMCDMLYVAVVLCGILLTATVVQLFFYPRSAKHKMPLSFSILGTAAAVTALLSGYFFFLIDKSVLHIWLCAFAGVPVGGIICLLHFLIQSKHEKDSK